MTLANVLAPERRALARAGAAVESVVAEAATQDMRLRGRPQHAYRPDIDGLRAIAVLLVICFHAPLGFRGGYLGVDVFFVISGYLITSLIMSDLERGRFSFAEFWERRVRRIFPALCLVVVASLIAGWFLLLPNDYAELSKSVVAIGSLVSNVHFWKTSGYFAPAEEVRPLLHTWSLAVEEQFYLCLPLLLYVGFRLRWIRRNWTAALAVAAVCLLGIGLAQYGVARHHIAAFYLLPFRAWELLCGCVLAFLPAQASLSRRWMKEALAVVGLAAIIVPAWLYSNHTPFPGLAAIPPCLGTALLIWLNQPARASESTTPHPPTLLGRLLSNRALVFIGLISYSLYLWHWPVLVFAKYWVFHPLSRLQRVGLILLSFVLAILSWKYVELPFRNRRTALGRARVFSLAGALTAAIVAFGFFVQHDNGVPHRFGEQIASLLPVLSSDYDAKIANERFTHRDFGFQWLTEKPADNRPPDILVWGDSHAERALPAFEAVCRVCGKSCMAAIRYGTAPVVSDDINAAIENINKGAGQAVIEYVKQNHIKDTFLVAHWRLYQEDKDRLKQALRDTIHSLAETGTRIWILMDIPTYDVSVPRALARNILFSINDNTLKRTNAEHRVRNALIYELADELSAAHFIDPSVYLQAGDSECYRIVAQGMPLYSDGNHLTPEGAMAAIFPALRDHFLTSF